MLGAVNLLASLNKCRPAIITSLCLRGLHFQARSSNLFCVNRRTMSDSKAETGSEPSPWQQGFYKYFLPIQTRFRDTDCFGHVNNAVYYSFFDTVINHYLYKHCSFRHPKKNPDEPNIVGFMVDTRGTFRKPLNFPEVILAGMAVTKLGNSSVTYTVGIFAEKEARSKLTESLSVDGVLLEKNETGCFDGYDEIACSVGQCVHVFVDVNGDQKPLRIPDKLMFYKIANNKIAMPIPDYIKPREQTTKRSQRQRYMRLGSAMDTYKFSYFPRTLKDWDELPQNIVELPSLKQFKVSLESI